MNTSSRFSIESNKLTVFVKPSPLVIRVVFLLLASLSVFLPSMGMVLAALFGSEFHIKYILILGVCTLFGFFFIRLFLWNSFGQEVIEIKEKSLTYYADYKWFKGNQQTHSFENLTLDFISVGFRGEEMGHLLFVSGETVLLESSVDLSVGDLMEIIATFQPQTNRATIEVDNQLNSSVS